MSDAGGNGQPTRHSILRHHPGYPVWMLDDPMSDGPILLLSHRSRRLRPGPLATQTLVPPPALGEGPVRAREHQGEGPGAAGLPRSPVSDPAIRSTETNRRTEMDRPMDANEWIDGSDREDVIDLDRRNAMDPDRSAEAGIDGEERMKPIEPTDTNHPGRGE